MSIQQYRVKGGWREEDREEEEKQGAVNRLFVYMRAERFILCASTFAITPSVLREFAKAAENVVARERVHYRS